MAQQIHFQSTKLPKYAKPHSSTTIYGSNALFEHSGYVSLLSMSIKYEVDTNNFHPKCLLCFMHLHLLLFECPNGSHCFAGKKSEYYKKMREDMKHADKEDKLLDRQRRKEKRIKQKMKLKRESLEEEDNEEHSGSEGEATRDRPHKKSKIYYDSDSDDGERKENKDSISLAEQEALALSLLNSMHS